MTMTKPEIPSTHVNADPLSSVTGLFNIYLELAEEERGPIISTQLADNAYAAIGQAMMLARPYKGEVFIATWFDHNGTKREVSVKVLDRK